MKEMKIIISGAGGFLGQILLNMLTSRENYTSIIALDLRIDQINADSESPKIILHSNEEFLRTKLDLNDYILINLAYARSSDFDLVKSSCEWTFALLEKLRKDGVKKYINISSQSIYDRHRKSPAIETDLPVLNELYDMGKYYLENWIREFSFKHDSLFLNLRLSSLVGPNFPQRIIPRLIKRALEDNVISINLNGQIFSYTHVDDIARAIVMAAEMENDSDWNKAYNVGSEEKYTIEEIASHIERNFIKNNLDLTIKRIISEANNVNSSVDSTLFRKATNWSEKYTLSDIVEEEFNDQLRKRDGSVV